MRPIPNWLFLALFPFVLLLFFQPHTPMLPFFLDANPLYPIYAKLESGYAGQVFRHSHLGIYFTPNTKKALAYANAFGSGYFYSVYF